MLRIIWKFALVHSFLLCVTILLHPVDTFSPSYSWGLIALGGVISNVSILRNVEHTTFKCTLYWIILALINAPETYQGVAFYSRNNDKYFGMKSLYAIDELTYRMAHQKSLLLFHWNVADKSSSSWEGIESASLNWAQPMHSSFKIVEFYKLLYPLVVAWYFFLDDQQWGFTDVWKQLSNGSLHLCFLPNKENS